MDIQKLMELCKDDFDNVLTISAKYGLGLERLKEKLREMVITHDMTLYKLYAVPVRICITHESYHQYP